MTALPQPSSDTHADVLSKKIADRTAKIGVIGLGYVGLPLILNIIDKDFSTYGFDIAREKINFLNEGKSYVENIDGDKIKAAIENNTLYATDDMSQLGLCDVILICVPTPLNRNREPDLSHIRTTIENIAKYMNTGTLVVLESTTYPGTTHEVVVPKLEQSGLKSGTDFFVAFSPEREDPANTSIKNTAVPKIVGGEGQDATELATQFYSMIYENVVPVSCSKTAEAVKITENIFRSVNIALVNELKFIYDAMGIDVWEVIDGAATKPFGYMPFYPGPGVGGHCIPVDPFYLAWKAREYDLATKFISLAGEINMNMPRYVLYRIRQALDEATGKGLNGSKILMSGLAYKKNVGDMRESPAMTIYDLLLENKANVWYYDPFVDALPLMKQELEEEGRHSLPFEEIKGFGFDLIVITTDHDEVDYAAYQTLGIPIVDTRNVYARHNLPMDHVTKA